MSDYISREAAIELLTMALEDDWETGYAADRMMELPAANVVEVKHGKWIVSRTEYSWNSAEYPTHCKCNQCGREVPYQDRDNYCPNCGCRMDGGDHK